MKDKKNIQSFKEFNENINSLPGKSPEEKLKKLLLSKNILPNSYHSKIDKLIKELVDEIEKSK